MSCSRGKASPNKNTELRLFAGSAGFCQNPACNTKLFREIDGTTLHIAEMAHVFAAKDDGPRGNASLALEMRGHFDNLILLCSTCHTTVDKAPDIFTDTLVLSWKSGHLKKIAAVFGAVPYSTRVEARKAILPALDENKSIFDRYNPDRDYRHNPESEIADVWKRKALSTIIPNNRKILAIFDANRVLLSKNEVLVCEEFRQHIEELEQRHLNMQTAAVASRFPNAISSFFE